MKYLKNLILFSLLIFGSCKKDNTSTSGNIVGQWKWTIQYANNPTFNSTPQSTGIQETLSFTSSHYTVTQNGAVTNAGTYRTSTATGTGGQSVLSILFTNQRITDSVTYYSFGNNSDSLFFSYDLIGTVGSGSRHYGRQ